MMFTNQSAFDAVSEYLLNTDKGRSYSEGYCRYRSSDGNKCAIGALIPDELYDPEMEGSNLGGSVVSIIESFPKIKKLFENVNMSLLVDLQNIHDDRVNWYYKKFMGKKSLANIAKRYNLLFEAGSEE